jgi:hypothetical protein
MPQSLHLPVNEVDARACRESYLTLGSIFLLVALLGLFVVIQDPKHNWEFVCIPAGLGIGYALWLRSIRLRIVDGELSYGTLFATRSIRLIDIEKAETQLVGTGRVPTRVLVIHPRPETTQKPMRVNIKVFSREDLSRLFDLLAPKFKGPRTIGVYTDESA